jgi:cytochrome c oxidase subunit 2
MNHDNTMNRRAFATLAGAAVLACASAAEIASAQTKAGKPRGRTVKMVARKFVFVPGELRVKMGEPLTLLITAPEVPMGINIPDFGTRADIVPGKVTKVQFTPDKTGTFTFLCDVFCGTGHEEMNGTLIVT